MFRHRITIGRIFGISLELDYPWFLIVGLMTWTSAESYFTADFADWVRDKYRPIGFAAAAFFLASVLIHELGRSVVSRGFDLLNRIAFLNTGSPCGRVAPRLECARVLAS
jgi:Zn-dependent protease